MMMMMMMMIMMVRMNRMHLRGNAALVAEITNAINISVVTPEEKRQF